MNVDLLSLNEGKLWLTEVDVLLLIEVVEYVHVSDLTSRLFSGIEFMLVSIELRNLLDSLKLCIITIAVLDVEQ